MVKGDGGLNFDPSSHGHSGKGGTIKSYTKRPLFAGVYAIYKTGLSTKKEAVELGLKALIKLNRQASIRALRGKLKWEGNLEEMRAK